VSQVLFGVLRHNITGTDCDGGPVRCFLFSYSRGRYACSALQVLRRDQWRPGTDSSRMPTAPITASSWVIRSN